VGSEVDDRVPLYEYQCPKCGRFELIHKFSDAPLLTCPTCGSEVQKLFSAPAIQFKGTGWYITDYARKGQNKGEGSKGESGKGESGKSEGAKSEGAKSDGGKSDGGKSDSGKSDSGKSDSGKSDGGRSEGSKDAGAASGDAKPTAASSTATKDRGGSKTS
jgi:putative FmdB family regulatory protein